MSKASRNSHRSYKTRDLFPVCVSIFSFLPSSMLKYICLTNTDLYFLPLSLLHLSESTFPFQCILNSQAVPHPTLSSFKVKAPLYLSWYLWCSSTGLEIKLWFGFSFQSKSTKLSYFTLKYSLQVPQRREEGG